MHGCYAYANLCEIPRLIGSPIPGVLQKVSSSSRTMPRGGTPPKGN
jgi:hypothetical protein